MPGRILGSLAVLLIASVLSPDPVTSQCTSKYCVDGDGEGDLWTMVLHLQDSIEKLQQQVTNQEEIIRSLKEEPIAKCMYCAAA